MDTNLNKIFKERYLIKEKLAIGGSSQIYLAEDFILNRLVVLKIMYENVFKNKTISDVFANEIKITAQMKHPNIVKLYDYFFFDNHWCLVLEYLEGNTLRKLLKTHNFFSEQKTINIILPILEALAFAKSKKIIHRDIKPENIFILKDGRVKILDFGVSVDKYFSNDLFHTSIIGSLKYLSPEMIAQQKAHWTSDLYSLGIIIFEMLIGELPFAAKNHLNLIKNHLYEKIPRIRNYDKNISKRMENIIIKSTAKNIFERYKNIDSMIEDLKKCLKEDKNKEIAPLFLKNETYQGTINDLLLKKDILKKKNFFWLKKEFLYFVIFCEIIMLLILIFKLAFNSI